VSILAVWSGGWRSGERAARIRRNLPLSRTEIHFGHSLSSEQVSAGSFALTLVALPTKRVKLDASSHCATTTIGGRDCQLLRVFAHTVSRWMAPPRVEWIDICGRDMRTGEWVTERITP
jgi:hypothetical protein